ncbi:MAG: hypothetical protein ACT4PO_01905, partial [Actinomycetota bacterium]
MKARTAARLAWSLCGLSVALSAAAILLAGHRSGGVAENAAATLAAALPFPAIGALIASRFPRNAIGW